MIAEFKFDMSNYEDKDLCEKMLKAKDMYYAIIQVFNKVENVPEAKKELIEMIKDNNLVELFKFKIEG